MELVGEVVLVTVIGEVWVNVVGISVRVVLGCADVVSQMFGCSGGRRRFCLRVRVLCASSVMGESGGSSSSLSCSLSLESRIRGGGGGASLGSRVIVVVYIVDGRVRYAESTSEDEVAETWRWISVGDMVCGVGMSDVVDVCAGCGEEYWVEGDVVM